MTFAAPTLLWSLLFVPIAVGAYVLAQYRRAKYAIRFTRVDLLRPLLDRSRAMRRHIPPVLYLLALSALLLGAARPQATVLVPRHDGTVVLTLDTSGSMAASDVEPNRMAAAQAAAERFIHQLPEEFQVGLVSFSTSANVLAQPTVDRRAVAEGIESLVPNGGTAIGDALAQSLELRPSGAEGGASPSATRDERSTAIVLLSDGENNAGDVDPMEAAMRAEASGVPVFTIALGTPEGALRIPDGRIMPVPPDHDTLSAIAERTGGEFFTAPTDEDLRAIYEDLSSRIGFVEDHEEVTVAFALAGLLLAGSATGLALRWTGRFP